MYLTERSMTEKGIEEIAISKDGNCMMRYKETPTGQPVFCQQDAEINGLGKQELEIAERAPLLPMDSPLRKWLVAWS